MPLYEYQCQRCGHRFEALVIGSRRPDSCPKCSSSELEKQYSTFGMASGSGYGTGSSFGSGASCNTGGG
ncbi:MAG: zinc ribbon domain-containing protein [Acidobacteriota bacterium]